MSKSIFATTHLGWQEQVLEEGCIMPAYQLEKGNRVHIACPEQCQMQLLKHWFEPHSSFGVAKQGSKKPVKGFGHEVGVVLNRRALIANLTIGENIMLPFLYHYQEPKTLLPIQQKLLMVAENYGISDILAERAGLRSPLVNSLVALCRSVLQEADFLIFQQPHLSMDEHDAARFFTLAKQAVNSLDAGMIYLSTSTAVPDGFSFIERLDLLECGQKS